MKENDARKRVVTYVILTFVLSAPFYYLVHQNGGLEGNGALYVFPLMWMLGVAGLITTFAYQRNLRGMGWGLGKPKYYLIAYLLPVLYATIAYGVVWLDWPGRSGF